MTDPYRSEAFSDERVDPALRPDPDGLAAPPGAPVPDDQRLGASTPPSSNLSATGQSATGSSLPTGEQSTTGVAKQEAAEVKDTAVDAGKQVAETAKTEAATVAAEAKNQARTLLNTAGTELRSQASTQQGHLAALVRGYADELQGLVNGSPQSGQLTDLARQAAGRGSDLAGWLEQKEPTDVLEEVRRFARRRPVAFLALCGLAGVVAGRLTRGAVAANTSVDSPKRAESRTDPSLSPGQFAAPGPVPTGRPDVSTAPGGPLYEPAGQLYPEPGSGGPLR